MVLVALVGMVVAPPALLLRLGFYDWRGLSLWTAADVRIVLLVLTVVGWLVWAIWMVRLATELVAMVGSGRRTLRLPGLSAPQRWLGGCSPRSCCPGVFTIAASALPIAATPSLVSGDLAAPTVARATALHHEAPRTASPAGAAVKGHAVRHVVTTGDDLWTLAGRYYGEGTKWRAIVAANPELQDDPLAELPVGQGLRIVDPVRLVTVQHRDQRSDRLQRLMLGGVNRTSTERLTAALELVRGAPLRRPRDDGIRRNCAPTWRRSSGTSASC